MMINSIVLRRLIREDLVQFAKNAWSSNDRLLRRNFIMFVGAIVACACNYFYQIYVGRALGPEAYGAFCALFSIYYLYFVFSGTFQAVTARFISKFNAIGDINSIGIFSIELIRKMALMGSFGFIIFWLTSPIIADFLNLRSTTEVIFLGTAILFSSLLPVTSGMLQGLQMFNSLALVNILTFAPKLIFGILLVKLGYGISGAIGAVALGLAVAFLFSIIPLRIYLKNNQKNHSSKFREMYLYSLPAVLIMMCLAVPSNVDVILAKHYLTSTNAGLYAAAAVLGKIVLFLASSIPVVMFPKVTELNALGIKSKPLLNKCLICSGLLSGSATVLFVGFPSLIGSIFGIGYADAYPIIKIYAITMFFVSLIWVIAQYCLATNYLNYSYILFFFTFLEIVAISIFHDSIMQMAQILMIANIIILLISYVYLIFYTGRIK
jgi:O-antigen/teichoic acid export membrane protein